MSPAEASALPNGAGFPWGPAMSTAGLRQGSRHRGAASEPTPANVRRFEQEEAASKTWNGCTFLEKSQARQKRKMQPSTQKFAPSAYNYLQPTTPFLPRLADDEFCRAQSSSLFCMMFWAAKQQSKEVEGSCGRACYSCHLTWCGGRGVFSTSVTTAASWSFCKTWERSSAAVGWGKERASQENTGGLQWEQETLQIFTSHQKVTARLCRSEGITRRCNPAQPPLATGCSHRNVAPRVYFSFLNNWCGEKAGVTVGFPGSLETPPFWHPFLFHGQHGEDGPWYLHTFWAVPYSTGDISGAVCKEMLQMSRGVASHHLANKWASASLFAQWIDLLPHPQNTGWVNVSLKPHSQHDSTGTSSQRRHCFKPSPSSLAVGSPPSRRPG